MRIVHPISNNEQGDKNFRNQNCVVKTFSYLESGVIIAIEEYLLPANSSHQEY